MYFSVTIRRQTKCLVEQSVRLNHHTEHCSKHHTLLWQSPSESWKLLSHTNWAQRREERWVSPWFCVTWGFRFFHLVPPLLYLPTDDNTCSITTNTIIVLIWTTDRAFAESPSVRVNNDSTSVSKIDFASWLWRQWGQCVKNGTQIRIELY